MEKKQLKLDSLMIKRQLIKVGDTIEFSKLPDLEEKLSVLVEALYIYSNFEGLFADFSAENFGTKGLDVKSQVENMENTIHRQK